MIIISYTFLLLCLWAFPVYISYKYLQDDAPRELNFVKIVKLASSFLLSVFLSRYIIQFFFIIFLVGPLFALIGFINYKINSSHSSNFIHISLAIDLSYIILLLLMLFTTFFGIITKESAIFFTYYGIKSVGTILVIVLAIGLGMMTWLYSKILPDLLQVSNRSTKQRLLFLNIVKISYSSLIIIFLQENIHTFRADIYIIVVIQILLGFLLNHYLFTSLLDYIRLSVDKDNLTILKEHYSNELLRKEELSGMEHNIQSLRHDLSQLINYFESVDTDSKSYQKMLNEIKIESDKNMQSPIQFSDHDLLDTYLYRFSKLCETAEIEFKCVLIWDIVPIESFQSIRLFSNLLTNSLEAVSKVEVNDRWIEIDSALRNDSWIDVRISNPYNHALHKELKSTKNNHQGLGIQQIKKIVQDNNGLISFEPSSQRFDVLFSIPVNQ